MKTGTEVTAHGPAADPPSWIDEAITHMQEAANVIRANARTKRARGQPPKSVDQRVRGAAIVAEHAITTAQYALFQLRDIQTQKETP